MFYINTV